MSAASWTAVILSAAGLAVFSRSASAQDQPKTEAKDPPEAPAKEPAKEPAKDPTKAPAKEPPTEPAKTAPKEYEVQDLDTYRLRTGDQVEIKVYNGNKPTPEVTTPLTVPGKGGASLPPIGRVDLLDRTVFDVQAQVEQKYKDEGYLANPNVGCVVIAFQPRQVYLIGAVHGTVDLPVQTKLRILEVLAKAGSLAPTGSTTQTGYAGSAGTVGADFSHVRVRRVVGDRPPFMFDVNVDDILERGQEQQNIVMFENDIVIVPRLEGANPTSSDFVYVLGKVHSPGRQPIVKGRTPFTLTKLIAICGDFQDFADRTKVRIIRSTPTGRVPYTIDFDDIISGDRPDFEMMPDDLVYVPENWI